MKAIATVDKFYGISKDGKEPLKLATLRKRQAKMIKNNAVLMSMNYFATHGPWEDESVETIVADVGAKFYEFTHYKKDIVPEHVTIYGPPMVETKDDEGNTSLEQTGSAVRSARHIQALFNYEDITGRTIYVVGDGELFETIVPFCTEVHLTVINKTFEGLNDFFPAYVGHKLLNSIYTKTDAIPSKQFSTEYVTEIYRNNYAPINPRESIYAAEGKQFLLVVGESGAGKDTTVEKLKTVAHEVAGIPEIRPFVSFTTRPMRDGETNGVEHYFITDAEADYFLTHCDNMVVAKTTIEKEGGSGGYRYFALVNEIFQGANTYVIDPNGIKDFRGRIDKLYPGSTFLEVYVSVPGIIRKHRAKKREGYDKAVYLKRVMDEKDQFTDYNSNLFGKYSDMAHIYKNYGFGQEKKFDDLVETIRYFFTKHGDDVCDNSLVDIFFGMEE